MRKRTTFPDQGLVGGVRRPFTPAPSQGPSYAGHLEAAPSEPMRVIGGMTYLATEAPVVIPVRPMPDPYPIAHRLLPFMVTHPYGPPYIPESRNLGRDGFPAALASLSVDRMLTYEDRTNIRRPQLAEPQEGTGGG